MKNPDQAYGLFESCAPLATLEDMERRTEAAMFGAGLTNVTQVHQHVVAEGLRGGDQDLLFEVVSSDFATKPFKTVVRISDGPTCFEPGGSPTSMSGKVGHSIHQPSIHS